MSEAGDRLIRSAMQAKEMTARFAFEFNSAIEDRLVELMIAGYAKDQIRLECYPDSRTVIMVDGKPDSEFRIDHLPNGLKIVGESVRSQALGDPK